VHEHELSAVTRGDARQPRIGKTRNVVQDARASTEGRVRHLGLRRVDRERRDVRPGERAHGRKDSSQLLVERDGHASRSRGLASDVEYPRAFRQLRARAREKRLLVVRDPVAAE
jgi:hypothetical protein